MPRRLAPAATALVALALVLGVAACGGKSPEQKAADQRAHARWETGLGRWRADMLAALNGISLLLSGPNTVERLQNGDAETTARLDGFERTLTACHLAIGRLGAAPEELTAVRKEALRACRSLESGAELVHRGVALWRVGHGAASISRATDTLGVGQRGLVRVLVALKKSDASE